MKARHYIEQLQLEAHPEGGFYKETYRSAGIISEASLPGNMIGDRHYATAIYFLLSEGDFSAFHRIKSDECWHFYDGGTLLIYVIDAHGALNRVRLGRNIQEGEVFQFVVPAGSWFASEPAAGSFFSLVGCTVSPGFDFRDFEMAKAQDMIGQYPQHRAFVDRLCRL